jgi:lanthanide-dependent methanol dehydrogenase
LFENNKKTYATQINKNGFIYTWQADNGTLIAAEKVHPFVNWATSVDVKTGVPSKDARFNTHQDYNTKGICPSNMGAKGISPAAYSPKTGLIYVPLNITCMTYEPIKSNYTAGQPWVGAAVIFFSGFDSQNFPYEKDFGALLAINTLNSRIVWAENKTFALESGIVATASNLVFYGTLDRWFKAVDAKTGNELWKMQLSSGLVGNPFTYSRKGKQYVGTLSGLGGWAGIAMQMSGCGPTDNLCTPFSFQKLKKHNTNIGAGALNIFSL